MAILEVIKYEGNNSTFVWKHPAEDFNTLSQLIVHESQEAIFFSNGQMLDLFGPGRHTLSNNNIPLIRDFISLATGGVSPFHAEVYFINHAEQMAIRWGTDSKIQYMEPTYQFPIQIGASGEMSLRVADSRILLLRLVGTETLLTQAGLTNLFRAFLMTKVKSYIAQTIKQDSINIFEIDEHLARMSEDIKQKLRPDFAGYGIALEQFFLTTIVKPDGDSAYEKFKSLHFRKYADVAEAKLRQQVGIIDQQTQAQRTVIEAEGMAAKRRLEGYTYQDERGFDVAEKVAQNQGTGDFTSAGIGLGMMAGLGASLGGTVGKTVSNAMQPLTEPASSAPKAEGKKFCEHCGAELSASAAFCDTCGEKTAPDNTCPGCGYVFTRPGKFCPGCGAKR